MDKAFSLILLVFSIFASGLASLLVFSYLDRRDRKLREQIESIESEEEYLQRLYRDGGKLNRSTYTVVLMALCIVFTAFALIAGGFAFNLGYDAMKYLYLGTAWMFAVAAGICFYHIRSILRIGDFEKTKAQFQIKKAQIEDRLR